MSCCEATIPEGISPTQTIYAIKAQQQGGNLASGNTDVVQQQTARGALIRLEVTERPIGGPGSCCPPSRVPQPLNPVVHPVHRGATSSGAHLQARMAQLELCAAQQNLALRKLRGIPGCPPVSTNPRERFAAYERRAPPAPCPDLRTNAGISHAVNGPCTNVIGIVQTWPPH